MVPRRGGGDSAEEGENGKEGRDLHFSRWVIGGSGRLVERIRVNECGK